MCTIDRHRPRGKPFCAGGCPMPEANTTCGETRTLDIINEFKRLYEKKMEEIDASNCEDCLQEKIKLQFDWINDLTEQNEMLVKAVEELEMEATERVKMLEDKLQKSAECICEGRQTLKQQNSHIHHLEKKTCEMECLSKELKAKKEECESLHKNMIDMRQALTEEVATKHDVVLKLKRECQELEERCIQADKQTAFRDDIIKGLRKEIKQLKQQVSLPEKPYPKDSEILRKEVKGEHVLVINHTRKIIKNGNTTVIYLRHDSETEKELKKVEVVLKDSKKNDFKDSNDNDNDIKKELMHSDHMTNCSKCRLKFQNKFEKSSDIANEKIENNIPICKSENNLTYLNSIKRKSNLTMASLDLTRRYTFAMASNEKWKKSLVEDSSKTKFIPVPEHVPVKMLINNLEVNKTQIN